jgi:protocatechuate 3,4-dioxygenase beta subunit
MAAVSGKVTFHGKPVAGAEVSAGDQPTVSDASGHYELRGLQPGPHSITASSNEAGAFASDVKVTLTAGEEKQLDIDLPYAGAITGTIVDQDGKPFEGAAVRFALNTDIDQCFGVADASGAFRCTSLTGGGDYHAMVFSSLTQPVKLEPARGKPFPVVTVKDGATTVEGIRIEVQRDQLRISGKVVDAAGAGVPDAKVQAVATVAGQEPQFPTWAPRPSTVTDQNGAFEIRDLAAGSYALLARGGGGGEAIVRDIAAGARNVVIKVERPGAIEGQIVGFGARPSIYVQRTPENGSFSAATLEGDRFSIRGLAPGNYVVTAQTLAEGEAKVVEVKRGETAQVTLTSHGSGVLDGTVTEWKTGAPLPALTCHTVTYTGEVGGITDWSPDTSPKTNAAGVFHLDPAPAGQVIVSCFSEAIDGATAIATVPRGGRAEVSMKTVKRLDHPGYGSIGAQMNWKDPQPILRELTPNGPAARAGLLSGDMITAIDGTSTEGLSAAGVMIHILNQAAGSTLSITVSHNGTPKTVQVTLIGTNEET